MGSPGAGRPGDWVVRRMVKGRGCRQEGSGRVRSLAKALLNWFCQGQPWGRCRVRRRAELGEPSGHREEAPSEGLGGHQLLVQTDASCPAGQVVRHRLDGPPGSVGGEAPRGEMAQSHAVLEVSDGVLDLGVAAMVGLEIQGFPPDRGRYGLKSGCDIAWEGAPPSGILVVRPPDAGDPRCAFPANAIRCKKRLNRIYLTSPSHN